MTAKVCRENGCEGKYHARGYCHKHYKEKIRSGDLLIIQEKRKRGMSLQELVNWCFLQITLGGPNGDCWNWNKTIDTSGYPHIRYKGKYIHISRLIMILREGDHPKLYVCHNCDNPLCINPNHLRWDTPRANLIDRSLRAKRTRTMKLNINQIRFIRNLANFGFSQYQIAVWYGVTQSNISMILTGKTWQHVT